MPRIFISYRRDASAHQAGRLYDRLVAVSTCAGDSCRVEVGPEPAPLPKSVLRPKRKKKPGPTQG